jgi:hypothetical protein
VILEKPDPLQPAFGEVEITATVLATEKIARVVFLVDGALMGELKAAPYRLEIDLGQDNVEHRFAVVAHAVSGATAEVEITTPRVRVDEEISVRLQQLYVTVSRDDRRVLDLEAEDFRILDEARSQELVTFARGDIPFTAMVLVDSSTSMAGEKLSAALAGARTFFNGMERLDEGSLLVFSDRILHTTPFTTFPQVLVAGLERVNARGGTALNDFLYLALSRLETRQGRRVVILLSDGVDSHSILSMTNVLPHARRSQALIYWLRLPYAAAHDGADWGLPDLTTAWRDSESYRREFQLLGRAVSESGGERTVCPRLLPHQRAPRRLLAQSAGRRGPAWAPGALPQRIPRLLAPQHI